MSPRPYRLGRRRASTERTRAGILSAARELIAETDGFVGFSIDAVARAAGVARMTVYYQFGSKRGLLEAVFDDLATAGLADRLPAAFAKEEPLEALAQFIEAFTSFWASDPEVIGRVRSLAALDPEFEVAVRARDERRRNGLHVIVQRITNADAPTAPGSRTDAIDILHTLTSFETYQSLAGTGRSPGDVARLIQDLAQRALNLRK